MTPCPLKEQKAEVTNQDFTDSLNKYLIAYFENFM